MRHKTVFNGNDRW